ncbi:MAG: SDR family NAD(P)-dependent oxidoreductase, partial [Halocynthiibacter sp.]
MTQSWIILGATSAMARAFARLVSESGDNVFLAGRDMAELKRSAADCRARGAALAEALEFDAGDPGSFAPIIKRAETEEGMINVAVFVGSMPVQAEIDAIPGLIDATVSENFTGPARFLQMVAPLMEERGGGTVVGVGS